MSLRRAHSAPALVLVVGAIFVSGCGGGEDETTTTTKPNPEREKAIEEFQGELDELSEQQQKQLEGN